MSEDRWARYAPLTGLVAVVLAVAGAVLVNRFEFLMPPGEIVDQLEDDSSVIRIGSYFGAASAFFLIWFAGSVRTWLRSAEGEPGRLSAVAFGGGVAAGACLLVGYAVMTAAAGRAGSDSGTTESAATALWDLSGAVLDAALPFALAVFVGAASVVAFRTSVMKRWMTWVSAVIALLLLSPVNYFFVLFGLLWVGVISVLLFLGKVTPTATE